MGLVDLFWGRGPLRPARVERTQSITVAAGALTVRVTASGTRSYVGTSFVVSADWSGGPSNPPYEALFDWGDGLTTSQTGIESLSTSAQHSYRAKGSYTVKVTVTELVTGSQGSGSVVLQVADALTVGLAANPTSGPAPLTVTFIITIDGGYAPYKYTLDFGDGSAPATGAPTTPGSTTATHTYEKKGSYTAKATVEDILGAGMMAQISIGSGVPILFPNLRRMFPRLFRKIDEVRQRVVPAPE